MSSQGRQARHSVTRAAQSPGPPESSGGGSPHGRLLPGGSSLTGGSSGGSSQRHLMGWLLAGGRGQGGNLLPGADLMAVTCRRRPARGLHRASRELLAGGLWGSSRGDPRWLRPGMLPMASVRGLFCLGRACGDGGLFSRSSLQRAPTSSTSQVRLLASRGWLRPPLLPSCGRGPASGSRAVLCGPRFSFSLRKSSAGPFQTAAPTLEVCMWLAITVEDEG
ncbi:hypothetical protein T492DRAFT_408523 [Pavlovales sp. CCMP2436]|nr:hypothetical protein T492DRAFT_408523 [Pavlovales sp. CCMP2436]